MRQDTRTSTLKTLVEDYERHLIETALAEAGGNQRKAAAALGVLPTTLHEKMKRLGLARRADPFLGLVDSEAQAS